MSLFLLFQVNTFIETLDLSDNDLRATGGTAMAYVLYENFYITDLVSVGMDTYSRGGGGLLSKNNLISLFYYCFAFNFHF